MATLAIFEDEGHDAEVLASADSRSRVRLRFVQPHPIRIVVSIHERNIGTLQDGLTVYDRAKLAVSIMDRQAAGETEIYLSEDELWGAKDMPAPDVDNCILHLLRFAAESYPRFQDIHYLESVSRWRLACGVTDKQQFNNLLQDLHNRGDIVWNLGDGRGTSPNQVALRLTLQAYERLDDGAVEHTTSREVFVAMWFDNEVEHIYEEVLVPAIESVGLKPKRVDREAFPEKIDDKIRDMIDASCAVIADLTHGEEGVRGSVYYEAGYAHGRGVPVLFTCRADKMSEVAFDTRQYQHIVWDSCDLDDFQQAVQHHLRKRLNLPM